MCRRNVEKYAAIKIVFKQKKRKTSKSDLIKLFRVSNLFNHCDVTPLEIEGNASKSIFGSCGKVQSRFYLSARTHLAHFTPKRNVNRPQRYQICIETYSFILIIQLAKTIYVNFAYHPFDLDFLCS